MNYNDELNIFELNDAEFSDLQIAATDRDYLLMEKGKLLAQVDQLRAELAALKPSWDNAPKWANYLALSYESTCFVWQWRESQIAIGKRIQSAMVLSWRDTLERRPEATP